MTKKSTKRLALILSLTLLGGVLGGIAAFKAGQIATAVNRVPAPLDVTAKQAELRRLQQDILNQEKKWRESHLGRPPKQTPSGLYVPEYPPMFTAGGRSMEQLTSDEWELSRKAQAAASEREYALHDRERLASEIRNVSLALCTVCLLLGAVSLVLPRANSAAEKPAHRAAESSSALAAAEAAGQALGHVENKSKALLSAFNKGRSQANANEARAGEPQQPAP